MKRDFTELFCFVDDFIINFDKNAATINNSKTKPGPKDSLSRSEVLTILIGFYQSSSDCFKNYYNHVILNDHYDDFKLVSYSYFTKLIGRYLPYLTILLNNLFDKCSGLSFVDS